MRTLLRSKVRLLVVAFAVVLAVPAVALAAELNTNAVLGTDSLTPTTVSIGDNSFDIKIWASGNVPSDKSGLAYVNDQYSMATDGTISANSHQQELQFQPGENYSNGGDYCTTGTSTDPQGCPGNPFVVQANLNVATGTPNGTTGVLTVGQAVTQGIGEDPSPDTGYVKVSAPVTTNHAPTVVGTGAADANGTEGDTLHAEGAFSDEDGDTLSLSADPTVGDFVDNEDGTWTWDLATNDDVDPGTITVTADDGNGGTVGDSFDYSAANANPAVSIDAITKPDGSALGSVACLGGNKVSLDFSFTDLGSADTHVASIDWGDNSTDTPIDPALSPEENVEHTYNGLGPYKLTVTVTDDDTGVGTDDNNASQLSFHYHMSGILSPFNPDGTSTFKYGSTVPVKVKITDCAGTPVSGLSPKLGVRLFSPTTPVLGINEDVYSTSNADTGNTLRYDASAGQYIYNYNTKSNMTPDSTASYYMIVEEASSAPNPVSQKFALKLK